MLSIAWVFHERKFQNPFVELGLFTLIGGIGLLGNGVCMWFLTEYAHLHYLFKDGVRAVCVSLEFLGKEICVISPVNQKGSYHAQPPSFTMLGAESSGRTQKPLLTSRPTSSYCADLCASSSWRVSVVSLSVVEHAPGDRVSGEASR